MEKIQRAIVKPICVSEAGTPNKRRIQAIRAPKNDKLSERAGWEQLEDHNWSLVLVPSLLLFFNRLGWFLGLDCRLGGRGVKFSAHFGRSASNHWISCNGISLSFLWQRHVLNNMILLDCSLDLKHVLLLRRGFRSI
jgi:hypothetical protein